MKKVAYCLGLPLPRGRLTGVQNAALDRPNLVDGQLSLRLASASGVRPSMGDHASTNVRRKVLEPRGLDRFLMLAA